MGKVQRVLGFCFGSDYIAPLSDRSTRGTRGTGAHMVIIKRKSNAPQIGTVGCSPQNFNTEGTGLNGYL